MSEFISYYRCEHFQQKRSLTHCKKIAVDFGRVVDTFFFKVCTISTRKVLGWNANCLRAKMYMQYISPEVFIFLGHVLRVSRNSQYIRCHHNGSEKTLTIFLASSKKFNLYNWIVYFYAHDYFLFSLPHKTNRFIMN